MKKLDLGGITVATVLPYKEDFSIDWDDYAKVLDYCVGPDGITAALVNGHAGEGGLLTIEERRQVIERTRAHIGNKPLLAGVIATSTTEAIAEARQAREAGADCAVLFSTGATRWRRIGVPARTRGLREGNRRSDRYSGVAVPVPRDIRLRLLDRDALRTGRD